VLYLAEVQKKSGVFGSGKAELKLLAQQRSEQNWSPASGEEIPLEDPGSFNAGALVMVEVTNKQVQGGLKEAGPQLVKILQNFSRFQEKFKTQEEEIDQWKASLTYQAEELNRRETELLAREEQVEQLRAQASEIERRQGEVDQNSQAIAQLRAEVERSKQDLEAAWTQLQGEREAISQSSSLDAEQANSLKEWLNYLAEVSNSAGTIDDTLMTIETQLNLQQTFCAERSQQLDQDRNLLDGLQSAVDHLLAELDTAQQDFQQAQQELAIGQASQQGQQAVIEAKQQLLNGLTDRLQAADHLITQLSQVNTSSPGENNEDFGVDLNALNQMPLNELQRRVRELQEELEKGFRFVSDQEEELTLQRMDMNEIEAKLARATDADRDTLRQELTDNQESFKFLNETLVGQRRNLRKQERIMNLHQATLWRRLGNSPEVTAGGGSVDLSPMTALVQQQKAEAEAARQVLETEIAELQGLLAHANTELEAKQQNCHKKADRVTELQQALTEARGNLDRTQERIDTLEACLTTLQSSVEELGQSLEGLKVTAASMVEVKQSQENAINQLQETITSLAS